MRGLEQLAFDRLKRNHPNIRMHGLRGLVASLIDHEEDFCVPKFIPDACEFVEDGRWINLYEIEDTSKLTERKLNNIKNWSDEMYSINEISVRIIVTDRYGMNECAIWSIDDIIWGACPDCGKYAEESYTCPCGSYERD